MDGQLTEAEKSFRSEKMIELHHRHAGDYEKSMLGKNLELSLIHILIRQLKKFVKPGMEILDVGTGSGILGIVALKLGAGHVVGTDLDPCAVPAVSENKEANQIEEKSFDMMIGNIIDDKEVQEQVGYEKYDIVTANILADVLVPLTPVIVAQMKKGAYYITSGILDVKEDVVVKAVKDAGLTLVEVTHQGEWVSVTARKD